MSERTILNDSPIGDFNHSQEVGFNNNDSPLGLSPVLDHKYVYHYVLIPESVPITKLSYQAIHLLSHIIKRQDYNPVTKKAKNVWVPVGKNWLVDVFGANGPKHLKELIAAKCVELQQVGNSTFYWKRGDSKFADYGICQHARPSLALWLDIVAGKTRKARVRSPRLYTNGKKKEGRFIKPDKKAGIIDQINYNYLSVTVLDEWQDQFSLDEKLTSRSCFIADRIYAKSISKGLQKITVADSGRVYHPVIEMSRRTRNFVRYDFNKIPVKLDIKACHPCLMAVFIEDEQQRNNWLNICKTDIYSQFVDEMHNRDTIKEMFQIAISKREKFGKAKEIADYIQATAPDLYFWLLSKWQQCEDYGISGNSVQMELQKLESKIFLDGVFKKLNKKHWCLPMHDGLMTTKEGVKDARRIIKDESIKVLGFELLVERQ